MNENAEIENYDYRIVESSSKYYVEKKVYDLKNNKIIWKDISHWKIGMWFSWEATYMFSSIEEAEKFIELYKVTYNKSEKIIKYL